MRLLILLILLPFIAQGQIVRTHPYYKPFAASGCTPDADAQKFIDSAGITDQTQKDAICTLVRELKDSSLWSSMSAIYPFVGGTASTHKWNLKDPRDADAAFRLTFSGTWSHTSSGADPNGSTAYANTYANPTSLFANNFLHISYYSTENTSGATLKEDFGALSTSNEVAILIKYLDVFYTAVSFNAGAGSAANTNSQGYYVANRRSDNAANIEGYKNGTRLINVTETAARNNNNLYIGARNASGTADRFSDRNVAFATIGTALSQDQARALNTIVEKFNDALGRGVQ